MIFTEFRFLVFFGLVLWVHWRLPAGTPRKLFLLAASYAFYAAWDWRFLSLILVSTAVDFAAGLGIARTEVPNVRRRWLALSLTVNLGLLGVFKYFDFFFDSAVALLAWLGFGAEHRHLAIVLPVGISFYTFQTLSYTIDVYRRRLQPTRSLLDVALFVAFFPQLVAGPIVRAASFLPQLRDHRRFAVHVPVRSSLMLFLAGFFKKACISDNVAPVVDAYFRAPETFDTASAWLAVALYAVQIYCDFSGYSDMAIATAALLGYQLGTNFHWPYLASDISAFWRRWHMSLSSWLRDYLYIPLGGNRQGRAKTYRNLFLTMLLGGLWHGAAWRFVLFGGLHGSALALHRLAFQRPGRSADTERAKGPVQWLIGNLATLYFVSVAFILFRAESLETAWIALRAVVFLQADGHVHLPATGWLLIAVLALGHVVAYRGWLRPAFANLRDWQFAVLFSVTVAIVLATVPLSAEPFIYFQF